MKTKNLLILAILILLFGINRYLDIFISLILFIFFIISSEIKLYYLYIFLLPWDVVLSINGIGSIFRIIQTIILAKYFFSILNNKKQIKLIRLLFIIYLLLYSIVSILFYKNIAIMGLLINVFIILNMKDKGIFDNKTFVEYYIFSIIIAIAYGVLHNSFISSWINGVGSIQRFSGIYEPNFMGMYINIAICLIFYYKLFVNKKYLFCLLVLLIGLLMTVSLTGFAVFVVIMFFNCIKYYKFILKRIHLVIPIAILVIFMLYKMNPFYYINGRIQSMLCDATVGNLSQATSGRSNLNYDYLNVFSGMSLCSKLLGTTNTAYRLINNDYFKVNYSHNTNIDIIFSFGVIGYVIILLYFIYESFFVNKYHSKLILLKFVILIYSFSLSMFTSRFYYLFLII